MTLRTHKTKIISTIGPASSSPEIMKQMMLAGMDVARINFSYGVFTDQARVIENLRTAAGSVGQRITIMADLPGPKMRIGRLSREPVELTAGDSFSLTAEEISGNAQRVSVSFTRLADVVKAGDTLYLNDGFIQLQVTGTKGKEVTCTVLVGGELRSGKGLNLPGIDLGIRAFTKRDHECLKFALEQGVDAVCQSFVEDASDIGDLRRAAADLGHNPFIIAKIERAAALRHLDAILAAADGIMIARGDLGVETPIEEIAVVQKDLTRKANRLGKPVITATQMLESMTENRRPTRAEATDVANAILDGTDCVMLSEESAVGKFPVDAVAMLGKVASAIEPRRPSISIAEVLEKTVPPGLLSPVQMVTLGVEACLRYGQFAAVFVPTHSGGSARLMARFRLPVWVVGVSAHESTCRHLQFSYGVCPVHEPDGPEDWNGYVRAWLRETDIKGNMAMLTEGPSSKRPGVNNRLEIIEVSTHG